MKSTSTSTGRKSNSVKVQSTGDEKYLVKVQKLTEVQGVKSTF